MEIMTRQQALDAGLTHYFPGRPCKRGHVALYYVRAAQCIECAKLTSIRDTEKRNASKRAKRAIPEEKKKIAAARKAHYEANRDAIAARRSEIYAKRQPEMRERTRKWHKENRGKVNAIYARRQLAKRNATPPWADLDAISAIYEEAARLGYHVDHIIPIQHKLVCGLHVPANLRAIPPLENLRKKNRFNPADFDIPPSK